MRPKRSKLSLLVYLLLIEFFLLESANKCWRSQLASAASFFHPRAFDKLSQSDKWTNFYRETFSQKPRQKLSNSNSSALSCETMQATLDAAVFAVESRAIQTQVASYQLSKNQKRARQSLKSNYFLKRARLNQNRFYSLVSKLFKFVWLAEKNGNQCNWINSFHFWEARKSMQAKSPASSAKPIFVTSFLQLLSFCLQLSFINKTLERNSIHFACFKVVYPNFCCLRCY